MKNKIIKFIVVGLVLIGLVLLITSCSSDNTPTVHHASNTPNSFSEVVGTVYPNAPGVITYTHDTLHNVGIWTYSINEGAAIIVLPDDQYNSPNSGQ